MRKELFLVVLILNSLIVCDSPTSPTDENIIILRFEGIVTDASNNSPIAGAAVNVYEWHWGEGFFVLDRAFTDQDGRYYLSFNDGTNCTDGARWLGVTADGYEETYSYDQTYSIKCTAEVQMANFQLEPL